MPDFRPQHLENELVKLVPLEATDFEKLYAVAADPKIWEQHPTPNRHEREEFQGFFEGALASNSAFLVLNAQTKEVIGSSRYYDYRPDTKTVAVGYTFLATAYWGGAYNKAMKHLMLNYAFTFAHAVILHIGKNNLRSQQAALKIGAKKLPHEETKSYGTLDITHYFYEIRKEDFI